MSDVRPSIADLRERVKSAAKKLIVAQAQVDACRPAPTPANVYQPLVEARSAELKRAADIYREALIGLADGIGKIPEPGPLYGI